MMCGSAAKQLVRIRSGKDHMLTGNYSGASFPARTIAAPNLPSGGAAGSLAMALSGNAESVAARQPGRGEARNVINARFVTLALCVAISISMAAGGPAQSQSGISGSVEDERGGVVVGAKVTLLDSQGAALREVESDGNGNFTLPGVAPGRYTVQVRQKALEVYRALVEITGAAEPPPLRIVLRVAGVRQSIDVTAAGAYTVSEASAATKSDAPIMETPISVQVIPHQVLQDQQIVHLEDALQNVSGVVPNNDSYGMNDSFTIRGFDQMEMTYEDGLRLDQYSTSGFPRDIANIDRVEVVKGPASMLYGQGEPGGLVNIVTKSPLDQSHFSLQQQAGSYGFYRTTLDATGPLGQDVFYRFNLDYQNEGSFRDFVQNKEIALFPTLQWRASDRTQATADFMYEKGSMFLDNGIPFLPNGTPANVPIGSNYADPSLNKMPSDEWAIKVTASHEFRSNWKVRAAYKSQYVDSPSANDVVYLGDTDGSGNLQRLGLIEPSFNQWTHQGVVDLTGEFRLFGVKHAVDIGTDYYYQDGHYEANLYSVAPINIYAPAYGQPYTLPDPSTDTFVHDGQRAYGAYVQDQVTLPGHVHVLAGFRFDRVNQFDGGFTQAESLHDHPNPTPRVGVLWQPQQHVSLFGSFSGNYGATPLGSLTPDGRPLPPESGHQTEFGVKTEWLDKRLSATASVYQIVKKNIPTADPANPLYSEAVGEARSRGVEFDIAGQITPAWRVIAGYSVIDCVTTQDDNTPSLAGLKFPGVPHNSGSLWSVYELAAGRARGLRFGAGLVGRSREVAYESPDGMSYLADRIPGFAALNAMAAYTWKLEKTRLTAQINANNLLDRRYFAAVNPSQAMPGAPFSVIPSLRLEF
jgi:iron complex outermembrane receptor protein